MGWQCKPQEGTIFMRKEGSHYAILLHWNFIVGLTGYCQLIYRILLLLRTAVLLVLYLLRLADQKCNLKFMRLTLNYSVMVISACTHPCDTNTFTHILTRIHLLQLKTHNIWINFFWNLKVFDLDINEISTLKSYI